MRTVAGRMRIPFSELDKGIRLATGAQSLAVNLGTGAAIGAVSNAATTAFDPVARRSDDYGSRIFHSFFRGGAGGLANAGVNHFVSSRLTGAAQRYATNRAVRLALERGASPEAAARYAALSMKAFGASRFVEIGTRSLASGLGGSASRGIEMGYENAFAGGRHRLGDFSSEMRAAFLQNAAQGALEAAGDRANRRWSPSLRAEHEYTVRQGAGERHEAARRAVEDETRRMGLDPPTPTPDAGPSAAADDPRQAMAQGAREADALEPPVRHDHSPNANDNAPTLPRFSAADDIAEIRARGARGEAEPVDALRNRVDFTAEGQIVTSPPRPPASGEASQRIVGGDDHPLVRGGRPMGDGEDVVTVRSLGPDEETGKFRIPSSEEIEAAMKAREARLATPRTIAEHVAANDGEMRPLRGTADLNGELMFSIGAMPIGSHIQASNPRDLAAARHNYDFLRSMAPNMEVMLVFHPGTGEYMVVQGGPFSAAKPSAEWIVERHSHPRLISDELNAQLVRSMPSATDGDFDVLRSEVNRMARGTPDGTVVTRVSKIDIDVNGYHSETTFSMTRNGPDDYSLSVTFHHPQQGETTLGPFRTIAEYEAHALKLTGVDFSTPGAETVRTVAPGDRDKPPGPPRAVRGEAVSPEQRATALTIGERMTRAAQAREELSGQRPRGGYDPEIAAAAHALDAQAGARRLGLVGERDSMIRLHAIINDMAIPPEVRAAVARAALDATRFDMVQAGTLKADDELMMFFHGAPADQAASYDRVGVDMRRVTGGADDDAGRGLYASQDFQSATGYLGQGGQVFPVIARRSELGNVIDVRPGTPLHASWDAFLRASLSHPEARTFGQFVPISGRPYLADQSLFPHPNLILGAEGAGRGARFGAFLRAVAADASLPPELRAAAADPHITLMDLGGIASWGNDRRMITDQAAIHHQRVADLLNEQMGFPRPKAAGNDPEGTVRSVQGRVPATSASADFIPSSSDDARILRQLHALAPESVGRVFADMADRPELTGRAALSDEHALALTLELRARGVPPDAVEAYRRALAVIIERGGALDLGRQLDLHAQSAIGRRLDVLAARQFGERIGRESQGPQMKLLLRSDEAAVIHFLTGTGSEQERLDSFLRARLAHGAPWHEAMADVASLRRVMTDPGLNETRQRWRQRFADANITAADLSVIVREHPDALYMLARTSPEHIAEIRARMLVGLIPESEAGNRAVSPAQFVEYVEASQRSATKSLLSEIAAIASSMGSFGAQLLKGNSTSRGRTNEGGLDIVAFASLPGQSDAGPGPVRVIVMDDKALARALLDSVSAMTGDRLWQNLYNSARDIENNITALRLRGGGNNAETQAFISGAERAVLQMRAAGDALRVLPAAPAGATAAAYVQSDAHTREVARILRENNIVLVVSGAYGNVDQLAIWLRHQGIYLDNEYLIRLKRELRRAGAAR